jgi:hypothetical protein
LAASGRNPPERTHRTKEKGPGCPGPSNVHEPAERYPPIAFCNRARRAAFFSAAAFDRAMRASSFATRSVAFAFCAASRSGFGWAMGPKTTSVPEG